MLKTEILLIRAREILDSRGNPTVSCFVQLADGSIGEASVPSGASTGRFEAFEKRDGNPERYAGKGVLGAVKSVNEIIFPALKGKRADCQYEIDRTMITLDATENKSNLGANAILSVSLAVARAAAMSQGVPLFRYLGGASASCLPVPMMNILNGGAHADNNIDIQEFMIMPLGAESMQDSVMIGAEIYQNLKQILKTKGKATGVGDEGGFAPNLSSAEEALTLIMEAIIKSGYHTDKVGLALDVASSEWVEEDGLYHLPKSGKVYTAEQLVEELQKLTDAFPIVSLEDPLGEDDFKGWKYITQRIGKEVMLVGDDLFVTNTSRLQQGIAQKCGNAILIKPNQIGTVSEVLDVIALAKENGYAHILSHRSGETEDVSIADFAVATHAGFIKTGAPCRSERVAKYNRLTAIEAILGTCAKYGIQG